MMSSPRFPGLQLTISCDDVPCCWIENDGNQCNQERFLVEVDVGLEFLEDRHVEFPLGSGGRGLRGTRRMLFRCAWLHVGISLWHGSITWQSWPSQLKLRTRPSSPRKGAHPRAVAVSLGKSVQPFTLSHSLPCRYGPHWQLLLLIHDHHDLPYPLSPVPRRAPRLPQASKCAFGEENRIRLGKMFER